MNNTQEYLEIISFMPVEITDMLELHEIRPAILSGFIRYFSTQYPKKEASFRISKNII